MAWSVVSCYGGWSKLTQLGKVFQGRRNGLNKDLEVGNSTVILNSWHLKSRGWQTFSVKGQTVNSLCFSGCKVFVAQKPLWTICKQMGVAVFQ